MIHRIALIAALLVAPNVAHAQWGTVAAFRAGPGWGGGWWGGPWWGGWGGSYAPLTYGGFYGPAFGGAWSGWSPYWPAFYNPGWNNAYYNAGWGRSYGYTSGILYANFDYPRTRRTIYPAICPPPPDVIRAALDD